MENKTLSAIGDTILEEPVKFSIDVIYPTFRERILQRFGKARRLDFELKPMVLGKLIQISKILLQIEEGIKENEESIRFSSTLAANHGEKLAEIVAICISPQRKPPKHLIKFLLNNLSVDDLKTAAAVVLSQMSIQNFLISIVKLKGMNILKSEASLQKKEEIIASSEQLGTS